MQLFFTSSCISHQMDITCFRQVLRKKITFAASRRPVIHFRSFIHFTRHFINTLACEILLLAFIFLLQNRGILCWSQRSAAFQSKIK